MFKTPPLPHNLYAIWARYARVDINLEQLQYQNAAREQFSDKKMYSLDI